MHFERQINKIHGGSEQDKEGALEYLRSLSDVESNTNFSPYEIQKTPEDEALIRDIEARVDTIAKYYGGTPMPASLDAIHIIVPGGISKMTAGKIYTGIHNPYTGHIGIEKNNSDLLFLGTLAHELFHLKGYKSFRINQSVDDIRVYRNGISMINMKDVERKSGQEDEYFNSAEEAIVAELTKRLTDSLVDDERFTEDIKAVNKIADWVIGFHITSGRSSGQVEELRRELKYINNPQDFVRKVISHPGSESAKEAFATGMFDNLRSKGQVEMVERYTERSKLYKLIDEIVEASNNQYTKDEVFDKFARAHFSGSYLPLAKIIESALGKGAFRKVANDFARKIDTKTEVNGLQ